MLGSIKAAVAAVATSIKSSLPAMAAVTSATVLTGTCIYYMAIKDGSYEKSAYNVRYMLEEYISQISIDSIVSNQHDGYAYTIKLDEMVDEIIQRLENAESNFAQYTGSENKKEVIEKLIRAEIISQYPDLRSEQEIKNDSEVRENELQGGVKIIRSNSQTDTSEQEDTNEILNYDIGDAQVLTYKPYSEFKELIDNGNQSVKKYFSIKPPTANSNVETDLVIKTTAENSSPVLTKTEIERAIRLKYNVKQQTQILKTLNKIMNLQEQYEINAVFVIAVAEQMSSCGTSQEYDKDTYNWLGVQGETYSSLEEATEKFCELIKNNYFGRDKYKVSEISEMYNSSIIWTNNINQNILKIYDALDIKIIEEDTTEEPQSNTDNSFDIVVAGEISEAITIKTIEYKPKEDGSEDERNETTDNQGTVYQYHEVSINYQNMLSKYSMPAGFLWSLMVMGEDVNLVLDLADLAIGDTEIIIDAQDNVSTTINQHVKEYKYSNNVTEIERRIIEEDNSGSTPDEAEPDGETSRVEDPYEVDPLPFTVPQSKTAENFSSITTTVKTVQSNTRLNLVYARTWVAIYKNNFKNTVENGDVQIDPSWLENAEREQLTDADEFLETTYLEKSGQISDSDTRLIYCKYQIDKYKKEFQTASIVKTINSNTYTSAGTVIQERTEVDEEYNFVAYLNKRKKAKEYITDSPSWLFEMLESHEKTANMLDLFKYLLYKTTDINYGVTTFDFSLVNNFSNFGYGTVQVNGTTLTKEEFVECIRNYSTDSGYQTRFGQYAEKIYDICTSKNINPVLCAAQAGCESGFGAAVPANSKWNYWGLAVYNDSSVGKEFNSIDEAITYYCDIILGYQQPGSIAYDRANLYAPYHDKITGQMNTIYDIYSAYMYLGDYHSGRMWDGVNVKKYLVEYMKFDCNHKESDPTTLEEQAGYIVAYLDDHLIKMAKEIFGNKIYNGGGSILECAEYVHKYMEDNAYIYDYGNLQISFEDSKRYRTTCCASYVTWVMQEAGYLTESEGSHAASGIIAVLESKGFTRVPVSEIQPGDVMYWDRTHVQIYAGDDTIYNAGGNDSVQSPNPLYKPDWRTYMIYNENLKKDVSLTCGLRAPN